MLDIYNFVSFFFFLSLIILDYLDFESRIYLKTDEKRFLETFRTRSNRVIIFNEQFLAHENYRGSTLSSLNLALVVHRLPVSISILSMSNPDRCYWVPPVELARSETHNFDTKSIELTTEVVSNFKWSVPNCVTGKS